MIRLGLLEAGAPPQGLESHGGYPDMFRALLGEDGFDYRSFDVRSGQLPGQLDACDGYLVTGSACGAYDPEPWIAPLEDWLRAALGKTALIGICFGHQIMAQAFGGRVIKSPAGWGLGAHRYFVANVQAWLKDTKDFLLPAAHQDQVVDMPPAAQLVAGSAFCPIGMLAWPGQRAMSLQLHPEFTQDYAAALVERRRGNGVDAKQADAALASLDQTMDRQLAAGWIRTMLNS